MEKYEYLKKLRVYQLTYKNFVQTLFSFVTEQDKTILD